MSLYTNLKSYKLIASTIHWYARKLWVTFLESPALTNFAIPIDNAKCCAFVFLTLRNAGSWHSNCQKKNLENRRSCWVLLWLWLSFQWAGEISCVYTHHVHMSYIMVDHTWVMLQHIFASTVTQGEVVFFCTHLIYPFTITIWRPAPQECRIQIPEHLSVSLGYKMAAPMDVLAI